MNIDRLKFIKNHTVFPNSFLRSATFEVRYPDLHSDGFDDKLRSFLKNVFGVEDDSDRKLLVEGILLKSKDSPLEFRFNRENALVTIDGRNYNCFGKSLFPYTRPFYEFVANVIESDTVKSIIVSKENQWVLDTDNPKGDLMSGLKLIFREKRLKELPDFSNVSELAIQNGFYTETSITIPETYMNAGIGLHVKYSDEKKLVFSVRISVKRDNVDLKIFKQTALDLNKLAYDVFIDIVSDEVISTMLQVDKN